jgi:hypothetical protein
MEGGVMTDDRIPLGVRVRATGVCTALALMVFCGAVVVAFAHEMSAAGYPVGTVTLGEPTIESEPTEEPAEEPISGETRFNLYFRSESAYAGLDETALETPRRTFLVSAGRNSGTGIMLTHDLMVTAAHVIADDYQTEVDVYCIRQGENEVPPTTGQILSLSREYDVALVWVEDCLADDAMPLRLRDEPVGFDTPLHMFGYQHEGNEGERAFVGVHRPTSFISAVHLDEPGCPRQLEAVAGQARHGNSGGPVFTSTGEVVGMIVLIEPEFNRTLIVPASAIRRLMEFEGFEQ